MLNSDIYTANNIIDATKNSAAMTGLFFGIVIFAIILGLISIISYWKIFNKAGKAGWTSLIPIYNYIVMIQIAKLSFIYILLLIIPVINIFVLFKINIGIAKKFAKTSGFGIGMTLLPIIFIPLLAFSDNVYEDNIKEVEIVPDKNIAPENKEELNQTPILNLEENNINEHETAIENTPSILENLSSESTITTNNEEIIETNKSNESPIINAFNTVPILTQEREETPTIDVKINNEISVNELPISTPEIAPQTITEIPSTNENISYTDTKKSCKTCGETLPNIVSICPKCGTDNE